MLNLQGAIVNMPMQSIGPQQSKESAPSYFGSVVIGQFVLAILCSIVIVVGVLGVDTAFFDNQYRKLALPIAIATLAASVQFFLRRYAFVIQTPKIAFISDVIRYAIQLFVLLWLFTAVELDSAEVLWIVAGASFLSLLPGFPVLWPIKTNAKALEGAIQRHWDFGKWIVPSTILSWAFFNLYFTATGVILGAAAVGAVKAAQNIVAISHILILGLEAIVPVSAARHFKEGGAAALTRYLVRFSVAGSSALGLIIVVAAFSPDYLLKLIYGDEFVGQGYLVRWWCAVYLFVFLSNAPRIGLRTLENTRPIFLQNVVLSTISIVICYPIIKYYGPTGVMAGLLLITALRFVFLTILYRHYIRLV
jgi:O-antigen/teichoic acid export membrane protein